MIAHFLVTFIRNFKKSVFLSFINVLGLSLGLTAFIYLSLYCKEELTFDHFHPDRGQIFKVVDTYTFSDQPIHSATVSAPMGPALVDNLPEVLMTVRINKASAGSSLVRPGNKSSEADLEVDRILIADSGFFKMFGFILKEGNAEKVLIRPNTVVLTETLAKKLFGNDPVVGKTIRTSILGGQILEVTGVSEDPPLNSHIQFNMLVSHTSLINLVPTLDNWLVYGTHTYIKVSPKTNAENLRQRFKQLVLQHVSPELAAKYDHHVVPVESIHLGISRRGELEPTGSPLIIKFLSIVGYLIIFLVSANFISLALSMATNRIKEFGIRKTLGSARAFITLQFIIEYCLLALFSLMLAYLVSILSLDAVNLITGKQFTPSHFMNSDIVAQSTCIAICAGLISGLFPGIFLSVLKPIVSLKNTQTHSLLGRQRVRTILVFLQFTIVSILIIGVIIVQRQLHYLQNRELGFVKEGAVVVPINSPLAAKNRIPLLNEFNNLSGISSASSTSSLPSRNVGFGPFRLEGRSFEDNAIFNVITVDAHYVHTMKLTILAGRAFLPDMGSDSLAFILNESAIRALGFQDLESALGKTFEMYGTSNSGPVKKGPIIGVSQDFHYKSLHENIEPLVLHIGKSGYAYFLLRLETAHVGNALAEIKKVWSTVEPNQSIVYTLIEDDLNHLYQAEVRIDNIFLLFTGLIILIACIGLLALASYTVLRKVKEISLRKVFGASTGQLVWSVVLMFLKLVGGSLLLACPLAYYVGTAWLETFAYHTNLHIGSFIIAGGIVIGIAISTVGYHALLAALTNPIRNLRTE